MATALDSILHTCEQVASFKLPGIYTSIYVLSTFMYCRNLLKNMALSFVHILMKTKKPICVNLEGKMAIKHLFPFFSG